MWTKSKCLRKSCHFSSTHLFQKLVLMSHYGTSRSSDSLRKNQSHNVCHWQTDPVPNEGSPSLLIRRHSPTLFLAKSTTLLEALLSMTWSMSSCLTALRWTVRLTWPNVLSQLLSFCVEQLTERNISASSRIYFLLLKPLGTTAPGSGRIVNNWH